MRQQQALRPGPNSILAVLALSGTSFSLLQSLVAPAIPELQEGLGTSASSIAWVLTAFLLASLTSALQAYASRPFHVYSEEPPPSLLSPRSCPRTCSL